MRLGEMRFRGFARAMAQKFLQRYDHSIVSNALLYDWQKPTTHATRKTSPVPAEATGTYLTHDNPRLQELEEAYAHVEGPVGTPPVWTADHVRAIDLQCFRTDDVYLWQRRGREMNELSFAMTYYYLKTVDRLRLFDRLSEDQAFS